MRHLDSIIYELKRSNQIFNLIIVKRGTNENKLGKSKYMFVEVKLKARKED